MENKHFDWDFEESEEDVKVWKVLPEGDYKFTVDKVSPWEKGDDKAAIIDVTIHGNGNDKGKATVWIKFESKYINFAKAFLINVGVMAQGDLFKAQYLTDAVGKSGAAHVTIMQRMGTGEEFNSLATFIDPSTVSDSAEDEEDDCPF